MKCYGDFVCSECATIAHKSFEIEKPEDASGLSITCPHCGKENVQVVIPSNMIDIIKLMTIKGYKILVINGKTLCIVIKGRYKGIELEDLPHEFILDCTESDGDIIINGRLRADDFEGIDKEQYIKDAVDNLLNWVRKLPEVGEGRYINMDEVKSDD